MKKILVIEDNYNIRESIIEILKQAHYEVLTAENGKLGYKLVVSEIPDLIICDVMMPVLDGFGVLHLLQKDPKLGAIPFIFLTAKTGRVDIRRGMESGADDFLFKPFNVPELLNAVETRLKKSELHKTPKTEGIETFDEILNQTGKSGLTSFLSNEREMQKLNKKRAIYVQGNRPSKLYYVLKGKVKTFKTNEDGKELITEIYKEGDFLGYSSLLEDTLYADNALTLEDTELMVIPKEEFFAVIHSSPKLSTELIKLLAKNLAEKEQQLMHLAYNSLRKRVADGLLHVYNKYKQDANDKPLLKIRREDLAHVVGVTKESLIRTLSDFKNEKLIKISNGEISDIKEAKLREMTN